MKAELPLAVELAKTGHELSAKYAAEHFDG
jgi:hypothetical protein